MDITFLDVEKTNIALDNSAGVSSCSRPDSPSTFILNYGGTMHVMVIDAKGGSMVVSEPMTFQPVIHGLLARRESART